jgi:hypothetical protein
MLPRRLSVNKLPFLLLFASLASAEQNDPFLHMNWASLAPHATERVEVNLDGVMLSMASKFIPDEDADAARVKRILGRLKGVYVHSYEFDRDGQYSSAELDTLRAQLRGPEWKNIVQSKNVSDGEDTRIYIKGTENTVEGLVVVSAERRELTVVSVVGSISPEDIRSLEGKLGIPKHRKNHRSSDEEE